MDRYNGKFNKFIMFLLFICGLIGFVVAASIYYNKNYIESNGTGNMADLPDNGLFLGFLIMIVIFDIVLGLMIVTEEEKIAKCIKKEVCYSGKCVNCGRDMLPGYVSKKNRRKRHFVYWKRDILGIYRAFYSKAFLCRTCGTIYMPVPKMDDGKCDKNIIHEQVAYMKFIIIGCIIAAFVAFAMVRAIYGGVFFTKTVSVALGTIVICVIFACILNKEK